ncbi:DUF1467 family protein [Allosediminivita pacifica]|uniref:Putative secreted protein n=1 Tax=Allosediminivita pacifica TaxID=1267769 RepID=A0A2T6B455_9RHOB|nr:DUF1467 family protein [Allosediminivita pacifica]PTX50803.1 putative secreted protein [Allosediminivita pacifica]GGB01270.1 hypothetical protein GCM10011324_09490 [Allosediminivita pacifica]
MSITSAIVLFAMIWFLAFLTIIPIRLKTQGDVGTVVEGTHSSSPEVHNLKKKAWITTGVTIVVWGLIAGTILSGVISVRDIDSWMFQRMGPPGSTY